VAHVRAGCRVCRTATEWRSGKIVEGGLKPSSDTATHLVLYRAFPGIGGIVHSHSLYATAWAQAKKDLPSYGTTQADYCYGDVPCTRLLTTAEIRFDYVANTGQVIDSLKIGTGSLALADNMLYYYNQRGEMNLVKPAPGKMELISKFKITAGTKEHFSHPVIDKGTLFIRHGKALMAYNIKAK